MIIICHKPATFFPLKIKTRNHKEVIYVNADNEKMSIHAYDFVTGNPSEKVKQKCIK